jgi:hypothetical protein
MNDMFYEYLDNFVVVYLDDSVIYYRWSCNTFVLSAKQTSRV